MNRAKRYSGPFTLSVAIVAFGLGMLFWQVGYSPKPVIRTVAQSPDHVTATMMTPQADAVLKRLAYRTSCTPATTGGPTTPSVLTYTDLEDCILAYINALKIPPYNAWATPVPPPSNREGQTQAVTPRPYVLHPGKTPLQDPTQDAYYRGLLKEGRFPISGSAPGRPEWTDYDTTVFGPDGHRFTQIRHRHSDGRDGVGPGQYCQRDRPEHSGGRP